MLAFMPVLFFYAQRRRRRLLRGQAKEGVSRECVSRRSDYTTQHGHGHDAHGVASQSVRSAQLVLLRSLGGVKRFSPLLRLVAGLVLGHRGPVAAGV